MWRWPGESGGAIRVCLDPERSRRVLFLFCIKTKKKNAKFSRLEDSRIEYLILKENSKG